MAKTVGEIKAEIDSARDELRTNIDQIANRVRSLTDWHRVHRDNMGVVLVSAMVGGYALARLVNPR